MNKATGRLPLLLAAVLTMGLGSSAGAAERVRLAESRIFIEYNATDNDLGFHVFLDGEDWRSLEIINPKGKVIFEVEGEGAFGVLGMTELFFEGAEPSLDEVPLEQLLALMPEGRYRFVGKTADGRDLVGSGILTHRIPGAPVIVSPQPGQVLDSTARVVIDWNPVPDPRGSKIVRYQVIVGSFSVTLPATKTRVTVPPEFLEPGTDYSFEVLAIEAGGNQTITQQFFKTR